MKQPTALRLAEALYAVPETGGMPDDIQAAADELVRLHEANQSMLAALKPFAAYGRPGSKDVEVGAAIAAIAKGEQA